MYLCSSLAFSNIINQHWKDCILNNLNCYKMNVIFFKSVGTNVNTGKNRILSIRTECHLAV